MAKKQEEKKDPISPIYAFSGLKNLLRSMGYHVRSASGYKAMKTKDIGRAEIDNIIIKDDGIYYKDDDGELRKIYMYKRNYKLQEHGKPRFHIRQCDVISDFMRRGTFNQEYRGANVESVQVCDMDNFDKETMVTELPLCKYCWRMAGSEFPNLINSKQFVDKLKAEGESFEPQKDVEVDFRGYTKDWHSIERKFLEKRNYTCEECGLVIENFFDHHFLRVHHKNNKRSDNRETNLQCLCPLCYAALKSVTLSKAEKVALEDFSNKYKKK